MFFQNYRWQIYKWPKFKSSQNVPRNPNETSPCRQIYLHWNFFANLPMPANDPKKVPLRPTGTTCRRKNRVDILRHWHISYFRFMAYCQSHFRILKRLMVKSILPVTISGLQRILWTFVKERLMSDVGVITMEGNLWTCTTTKLEEGYEKCPLF